MKFNQGNCRFIVMYACVFGRTGTSVNSVWVSASKLVDNQHKKEIFASNLKSFQSLVHEITASIRCTKFRNCRYQQIHRGALELKAPSGRVYLPQLCQYFGLTLAKSLQNMYGSCMVCYTFSRYVLVLQILSAFHRLLSMFTRTMQNYSKYMLKCVMFKL